MPSIQLLSIFIIPFITLISGFYPFLKKARTHTGFHFPIGESLAVGIFLGMGLIHMLSEATITFYHYHYAYPTAFLLAGCSFLFFLLLEHIAREIYHKQGNNSHLFAVIATIMLSIHSFMAGAALGLSSHFSLALMMLIGILAHKWAASFALATRITLSNMKLSTGLMLFLTFALMTPFGTIVGNNLQHHLQQNPLYDPIFRSLAAGTFLYLGTLHGLDQAILVKQCCNLKRFSFVIIGFMLMALVAYWT